MSAYDEVQDLLREDGAELLREYKHPVYRLSNGKIFVSSKTPSDHRAWRNCLSDLRRQLGKTPTFQAGEEQRVVKQRQQQEYLGRKLAFQPKQEGEVPQPDPNNNLIRPPAGVRIHTSHLWIPTNTDGKYRKRYEKKQHGQVRSYPPEVIDQYNRIARLDEDKARSFLEEWRLTGLLTPEAEEIETIPQEGMTVDISNLKGFIAEKEAEIKVLEQQIEAAQGLMNSINRIAPVKAAKQGKANGSGKRGPNTSPRGSKDYAGKAETVLLQSNRPLTIKELWDEIQTKFPEMRTQGNNASFYQSMRNEVAKTVNKRIVEVEGGRYAAASVAVTH